MEAALSREESDGQVEEQITKLKLIKRMLDGSSGVSLLRKLDRACGMIGLKETTALRGGATGFWPGQHALSPGWSINSDAPWAW